MSIYFVQPEGEDALKIGFTVEPGNRLAQLQNGNHRRLRLVAVFPGGHSVEQRLHKAFSAQRIHGEWFHIAGPLKGMMMHVTPGLLMRSIRYTEAIEDGVGSRHDILLAEAVRLVREDKKRKTVKKPVAAKRRKK